LTSVSSSGAALQADSQALASLSEQLSGAAGSGTPPVSLLVMRSRVEAAVAQQLADQAKLASPAEAKKLTTQSRARARTAHQLADQALAVEAEQPAALLAMADARRLEGERTVEVERWLRRARQNPAASQLGSEPDLVTALLRVRDDRLRDARVLLDKLAKSAPAGDVRARFRLAWIDYLDANPEEARSGADAVLKAQAEHPGARALLAKLDASGRPPVDTADPMPPEQKDRPDDKVGGKPGDKPGDRPGDKGADDGKVAGGAGKPVDAGGDSFDVILDRADKLAENGNCPGAMPLYRKVLDLHPASVEALTGLGYCHLDRREFASAHARFRAALGISSRYQPAMWGIAEAYQQQGLKQEALERFEAFVAEHPGNPRAEAARSRIEALRRELGAGSGSQGSPDKSGESAPPGEESAAPPASPAPSAPAPAPSPGPQQQAAGNG
jgi:tetratricopeptide (TPR) repeat protein